MSVCIYILFVCLFPLKHWLEIRGCRIDWRKLPFMWPRSRFAFQFGKTLCWLYYLLELNRDLPRTEVGIIPQLRVTHIVCGAKNPCSQLWTFTLVAERAYVRAGKTRAYQQLPYFPEIKNISQVKPYGMFLMNSLWNRYLTYSRILESLTTTVKKSDFSKKRLRWHRKVSWSSHQPPAPADNFRDQGNGVFLRKIAKYRDQTLQEFSGNGVPSSNKFTSEKTSF